MWKIGKKNPVKQFFTLYVENWKQKKYFFKVQKTFNADLWIILRMNKFQGLLLFYVCFALLGYIRIPKWTNKLTKNDNNNIATLVYVFYKHFFLCG